MALRGDRRSQPLVLRAPTGAGTAAAVTVSGELDVTTAPTLRPVLADIFDPRPGRLIFDLIRVDYIDCAAARVIVRAGRSLPAGRRVVIRPSPVIRKILGLTGLSVYCQVAGRERQDQRGARSCGQLSEAVEAAVAGTREMSAPARQRTAIGALARPPQPDGMAERPAPWRHHPR